MIINTIYGPMDSTLLVKKSGSIDTDIETTSWVEYWKDNELVHRSVHVNLKQGIDFGLSATSLV